MMISLFLFQYVQLSIGAKLNLHGPGRLKVVMVVMGVETDGKL
jgi:hypothetical protein